jgi:hypothetical protein
MANFIIESAEKIAGKSDTTRAICRRNPLGCVLRVDKEGRDPL